VTSNILSHRFFRDNWYLGRLIYVCTFIPLSFMQMILHTLYVHYLAPLKLPLEAGRWWHTPLIPALRRQRQVNFWVKASLVYRVSSKTARAIQRNPVSKKKKLLLELSVMAYTCSPSIRDMEADGSELQRQPWLSSEFPYMFLGYMWPLGKTTSEACSMYFLEEPSIC
jgi:hypothetical protein